MNEPWRICLKLLLISSTSTLIRVWTILTCLWVCCWLCCVQNCSESDFYFLIGWLVFQNWQDPNLQLIVCIMSTVKNRSDIQQDFVLFVTGAERNCICTGFNVNVGQLSIYSSGLDRQCLPTIVRDGWQAKCWMAVKWSCHQQTRYYRSKHVTWTQRQRPESP